MWVEWYYLLIVNAVVGILLLEHTLRSVAGLFNISEEDNKKYAPFARLDIQNLCRWKLYPFAMTILPAKFFGALLMIVIQSFAA